MPYIKEEDREALCEYSSPCTAGELNYAISILIGVYALERGLCYQTCNDIMGALTGALHEFQRRIVDPYENKKIEENGDLHVYESLLAEIEKTVEKT